MKKRSMILALASMLGISAAATAVSGFAWFTAQTTASVASSNYIVGAAQGSLEISQATGAVLNNCTTNADNTGKFANNNVVVSPTTDGIFADVSSRDGKNFYKLSNIVTTAGSESADMYKENARPAEATWMSRVNSTQMVAVSWTLTVANGDAGSDMDVYLSNSGAIFKKTTTATNDYSTYYRLAVLDEEGTCVYLYSNDGNHKGLSESDFKNPNTEKTQGQFDFVNDAGKKWDGKGNAIDCVTASDQKLITSAASTGVAATVAQNNLLLIKGLKNGEPQALTFVVWCEGTATPEEEVKTNSVDLAFDLAGIAIVNA